MPPKAKTTKEKIIDAATELVRESGSEALGARALAARLGCSTQPIFSNFASMDEVRTAVIDAAETLQEEYIAAECAKGEYPPYKASGMAYIRFAGEERELFKLLYMRDRSGEEIPESTELGDRMADTVTRNIGLESDTAKLFHLEMWAFVHGIAAMIATNYLTLDEGLISRMLTDAYKGLTARYKD